MSGRASKLSPNSRLAVSKAACWMFAGAALSAVGLMHAYTLTPAGIANKFGWLAAPEFAAMYALTGLILAGLHFWNPPETREQDSCARGSRDRV